MSEGKKINEKSIMRVMERSIKELVARNTGSRKVVSKSDALKPLAENKNKRGVVVIKNIKSILDDPTKLQKLRRLSREVISERKRIQIDQVNEVIRRIKQNPDILIDVGFDEIYTPTFTNYIRNVESAEGIESKQEKEPEVKIQKPLDVIDIKSSTKDLKSWLDSNASKYYESLDSKDESQQRIRNYYEDRLEEFTRREIKENMEKEDKEKPQEVKVVKPTIAERTQDEPDDGPKVIMTKPKIEGLPTNQELKIVQRKPLYKKLVKEIDNTGLVSLISPGYANEFNNLDTSMIPASLRFLIEPIVERFRSVDYRRVAEGFALYAMFALTAQTMGIDPKSPLGMVITSITRKIGGDVINQLINQVSGKKKIDKPDDEKKQIDKPDDVKQQPSFSRRIVPPLIKAGVIAGVTGVGGLTYSALKNKGDEPSKPATASPAQAPPDLPDTLRRVVETATSGISTGMGAIGLNEMRRQIVEANPDTAPYIDNLTADQLTNLLGGILGYKAGQIIKEKTGIDEKITKTIKQDLGIKETPIQYDPKVLKDTIATYEQDKPAKYKVWQPKTIYPSTSILDESNQEKYIDDLETSAFDYIAPTSEGSAGTIYTNPLKRQQYINERMRLEGAGMYIPYKTWGRVNDPSKMSEEQMRLMLLGPKLPELKFYGMDNATTFENVQTVHLVNNEQNSIEMFSPYSQFSNVDNNWWTNEDSVLYTINP